MARDLGDARAFEEKYAAYRAQTRETFRLRRLLAWTDAVAGRVEDLLCGRSRFDSVVDPVYVMGNFRSGTSMLERVLSMHPGFGYYTFLTSTFPRSPRWSAWLDRAFPKVSATMTAPHHPNLEVDNLWPFEGEAIWRFCQNNPWSPAPCNVLDATYNDPPFERQYVSSIHKHVRLKGARRFLNKNPLNTYRAAYLARLFPSARFVYIVRHPSRMLRSQLDMLDSVMAAVGEPEADYNEAYSNTFMPPGRKFLRTDRYPEILAAYAKDPALGVALSIVDADEVYRRSVEGLEGRVHALRYEDLLADFEPRMTAIFEFLGLRDEDAARVVRESARGFIDRALLSNTTPLPAFDAEVEAILAPMRARYGYAEPEA